MNPANIPTQEHARAYLKRYASHKTVGEILKQFKEK